MSGIIGKLRLLPWVVLTMAALPAHAEEVTTAKSAWTASVNGQASREDTSGARTLVNGSLGLQWQRGPFSLGATVGASGAAVRLPDVVERVSTSAFTGGLNFGLELGRSALELDLGYSRQGLTGNVTAGSGMSGVEAATPLQLTGSVVSTSLGGAFSHAFGGNRLTVTPRLALAYDRTRTSAALTAHGRTAPVGLERTSQGASFTPEIDASYAFSDKLTLSGSAAFTAATNGAASRLSTRPLTSGYAQTGQQQDSASQWGTLAVSAQFSPGHHIAIVPSIGTTVGRSTNEYFAGTSLAVTF